MREFLLFLRTFMETAAVESSRRNPFSYFSPSIAKCLPPQGPGFFRVFLNDGCIEHKFSFSFLGSAFPDPVVSKKNLTPFKPLFPLSPSLPGEHLPYFTRMSSC